MIFTSCYPQNSLRRDALTARLMSEIQSLRGQLRYLADQLTLTRHGYWQLTQRIASLEARLRAQENMPIQDYMQPAVATVIASPPPVLPSFELPPSMPAAPVANRVFTPMRSLRMVPIEGAA